MQGYNALRIAKGETFGLSNIAATTVNLLGYEAPDIWDAGMLEMP